MRAYTTGRLVAVALPVLVALLVALVGRGGVARAAQGAPVACAEVRPAGLISIAEAVRLESPPAASDLPPVTAAIATGQPADEAIAAELNTTVAVMIACSNAGDLVRAYSYFSPIGLRRVLAAEGLSGGDLAARLAAPPAPAETPVQLVAVRDAEILGYGRAGAVVETVDATTARTSYVIFTMIDWSWLIEAIVPLREAAIELQAVAAPDPDEEPAGDTGAASGDAEPAGEAATAGGPRPGDLAGVDGRRYAGPTWRHNLEWDESWTVAEATSTGEVDLLVLENGTSEIALEAFAYTGSAFDCLAAAYADLAADPAYVDLHLALASNGFPLQGGDGQIAFAAYDALRVSDASVYTFFVQCRVLVPGEAMLLIVQGVPDAAYNDEIAAREALLATLAA